MIGKIDLRILLPADKPALMDFAKQRLAITIADVMEREMQSWSARWRAESLDHYLPLGWSFGAFTEGRLAGFILAQPLLFYRGLTQTLWVEHIEAETDAVRSELLDTVTRWARDKHLQCVLREGDDGRWIETKSARYT